MGVGKVPLDVGIPCPNRVQGGCIYCRPASFTPGYLSGSDGIMTQLTRGKQQLLPGRFSHYFGYFQQETTTALAPDKLLPLLASVLADPQCLGLILSTRPDYLPTELLERLSALVHLSGKECLLELGLQSLQEKSLRLLNRNHSVEDFFSAAQRVRDQGNLELGVHLIMGIPGESVAEMEATLSGVLACGIQALKLHHLQVIADTPLHSLHLRQNLSLFTLEGYLELLLRLLPLIPADITIHRLWSTSHPDILVAPRWQVLPSTLSPRLQRLLAARKLFQGCRSQGRNSSA